MPEISLIIAFYQAADTLRRCLESVFAAVPEGAEVIAVDDGSTDGGHELCRPWTQSGRLVLLRQAHGGLSAARNAGLQRAQGTYVTFVDADDTVAPGTYEALLARLHRHPRADLLEFSAHLFYGSRRQQLLTLPDRTYATAARYWLQGEVYRHAYACNKVFRRSLFADIKFPEGRVFEDMAVLPALLQRARCVATTSQGLYRYHDNAHGLTARADGAAYASLLAAHVAAWQQFGTQPDRAAMSRWYMAMLNIQLQTGRLTAAAPLLPPYAVQLLPEFPWQWKLKIMLLRLMGLRALCALFHKMGKR